MPPAAEIAPIDPHLLSVAEIQLFIVVANNELFRRVHLALWNDDPDVAAVEVVDITSLSFAEGTRPMLAQNNLPAAGEMSIPSGMGRLETRTGSGTLLPMPMPRM
jgi:hypothetical protein